MSEAENTDPEKSDERPGILRRLLSKTYVGQLEDKVHRLEDTVKNMEGANQKNEDLQEELKQAAADLRDAYTTIDTLQSKIEGMKDMFQDLEVPYMEIDKGGIIKVVSPNIEDCFGYKPEDLINNHLKDYMVDEKASHFLAFIPTLVKMEFEGASHRVEMRAAKGKKIMYIRMKYIQDDKGEYAGTVVFFEEKSLFRRWRSNYKNEYNEVLPEVAEDDYMKKRMARIFSNAVIQDVATIYFDASGAKSISDKVANAIVALAGRKNTEVYIKRPSDEIRQQFMSLGFRPDHFEPSHIEEYLPEAKPNNNPA
ncbi:PAS domain S-box protein [Candidatus Woesearchaeota archaeon]|nr:PAS domain S-box protein [Candidatus Woesearchaeota archaeon]